MSPSFQHLMPVTERPAQVFVSGQGAWLWDAAGTRYLDWLQGWAVNALGHCPPEVAQALQTQAGLLLTPSPAVHNLPSLQLAEKLCALSGMDQVFFGSTGAEANEGAIKLARKWGRLHRGGAHEIITFDNAFHGRNLATMAASGKAGWDALFPPNMPGFVKARFNDIDSVKALLSYLHTPFLKIAFIDKGFFEQPEHPARVLLNSLAEAGVRWVSNDGSDQYDIFTKIKTTVFRLLHEFKNDVRIFAELLIEFNAYTNNVARRQELMERRALEKAQGEEKLREAKLQVNHEVRSRTDNREMPSAILLLLLQPWSDYLSFVLLRYGDKSESWARALKAIDDLLWSLELKDLFVSC